MAKVAAPKNDTGKPADHLTVIAAGAVSNNDLCAISLRPNHAPQRLRLVNNDVAKQTVVFRGEDDTADTTVTVMIGSFLDIDTPVKTAVSAGANVEIHCYWWAGMNPNRNR